MAVETVTVDRRLYVTADGEVVGESDGRAKRLLCIPGDELERAEAERVGLLKQDEKPADKQQTPAVNKSIVVPSDMKLAPDAHVCPTCGYEAKSPAGLGAHQRTHRDAE